MYKEHKSFTKPKNPKTKIWRYFDFTKFVSLLDRQSLFFARSDKLGDAFEGALTKLDIESKKAIRKQLGVDAISNPLEDWRKYMVINSWHENEYESAAMWKLYLKSDEGIAIQTTFERFSNSFTRHLDDIIYIGQVNYTDYENEVIPKGNIFNPFLHKRKSFEHEKEVRAVIWRPPKKNEGFDFTIEKFDTGLYVQVDLDILISNIYISPYTKDWFFDLVTSVARKYGIKANVISSELNKKPYSL